MRPCSKRASILSHSPAAFLPPRPTSFIRPSARFWTAPCDWVARPLATTSTSRAGRAHSSASCACTSTPANPAGDADIRSGASWSEGAAATFAPDASRDRALPPKCAGRGNPVHSNQRNHRAEGRPSENRVRSRLGLQLSRPPAVDKARPAQSAAAPANPPSNAAELLAARERGPTPLLDDLRELCDGIGGRPTGSKACDRAVDWAAARFRAAGVDRTWTETYTIPSSWAGGADHAECLAPVEFPIRLAADPFTAPTPGGRALETPLVNAGDGSTESFARLGDKSRGAIALVLSPEMKTEADLFAEYGRDGPMIAAAQKAGVAALLIQSSHPGVLLYRHPLGLSGASLPLPAAIVARIHAARLARLCERGEVRVRLDLPSRLGGPYQARNVVAEIPGRERHRGNRADWRPPGLVGPGHRRG